MNKNSTTSQKSLETLSENQPIFWRDPMDFMEKTVVDLFHEQVERTPQKKAVVYKRESLTFEQLDDKANRLANHLIAQGVKENDLVCICLDRSLEMVIGIMGILKANAAYVPIDPRYPAARLGYLLDDSGTSFLVSTPQYAVMLKESTQAALILLDNDWFSRPALSGSQPLNLPTVLDLAYVIYTSGSTGNPKGVVNDHGCLANHLLGTMHYVDFSNDDTGCFAHLSFSFDPSVSEMLMPLITGKLLVLGDGQGPIVFDDENLKKFSPYDYIRLTPSHLPFLKHLWKDNDGKRLAAKYIIGGEAIYDYHFDEFRRLEVEASIINEYGPTETTIACCIYKFNPLQATYTGNDVPIGKAMPNVEIYILDEARNLQEHGEIGEIYIGGRGVSRGYHNREELTMEKFVPDPFLPGSRMYRSGDLGLWLPDGNLAYRGRMDDQVKVRGHRIELGEVEAALLTFVEITQAVVIISDHGATEPRLIAYVKHDQIGQELVDLRGKLAQILPEHMLPSIFMWVTHFALTPNGKIDKKNLPLPEYVRPASAPLFKKPATPLEQKLAGLWRSLLQVPSIGVDDNFFEMGGTSLLTQKVIATIKIDFDLDASITQIYQYPTISTFAKAIAPNQTPKGEVEEARPKANRSTNPDVAIIGMAGRFPGASTIDELWEVLREGRETISFFTKEELDPSIPKALRDDAHYVAARGILPSAKTFDAGFFGLTPKTAEAMDPQQRLFLEIAWEALEQAGYLPQHHAGDVGVYAGSGTNTYYLNNVLPNGDLLDQVGAFVASTLNEKDYIASRTAYQLNLNGPAVSVYSACSTSSLAIAQAVEALRAGKCQVALAGGASITAPMYGGHRYQEGAIMSADGHCQPFDASSKGTVFSDGAGVVLLKNLADAERDGDTIYGVIKGVGVNNDGGNKGSFTAPSAAGQAGAIQAAIYDAQIDPATISYIEAHGTATPIGDPIEVEGLKMAFGDQREKQYCAIGSIKSNMGHMTAAAGVAGVIKTVLAMRHGRLPASLGFQRPNPMIDFGDSPFFVNAQLRDWSGKGLKRAGVSSFGVGGTNVHLILEEYIAEPKVSGKSRPFQLLTWSAKTAISLEGYQKKLTSFLQSKEHPALADVAYSLHATRATFRHRAFSSIDTAEKDPVPLSRKLNNATTASLKQVPNGTVFLFPGQGAQYLQMGRELYEQELVYRQAIDTCAGILEEYLKEDIRKIIFADTDLSSAEEKLNDTRYTQPALFMTEYALAQLWIHWGITPTLLCGHSIGEFVAAHLAGVFTLSEALKLIAGRGNLLSRLPRGSMLAVRMEEDKLREILPSTLSIAAINSNQLCVVAGTDKAIDAFGEQADKEGIPTKLLRTSHAFHSTMMDGAVTPFKKLFDGIELKTPQIPIISTVTGKPLTNEEATDPHYWADHMRATVRFAAAIDTVLKTEDQVILEVGPGIALTTLTRQQSAGRPVAPLSSLPLPKDGVGSYPALLDALGKCWLQGLDPDWKAYYEGENRLKIDLPSYAFDRKACWAEPILKSVPIATTEHSIIEQAQIQQTHTTVNRKTILLEKITRIVSDSSGIDLVPEAYDHSFIELGLDSLILTQLAILLKREFELPISFRQLNEDLATPQLLAAYLDAQLPRQKDEAERTVVQTNPVQPEHLPQPMASSYAPISPSGQNSALGIIAMQLQLLGRQVELLQGSPQSAGLPISNQERAKPAPEVGSAGDDRSAEELMEHKKPFGASPRIERQNQELNGEQHDFLKDLIARYTTKTAKSKASTQRHRPYMADPRVVTGFKPALKEMVYPLVIKKSKGATLWDLDDNQYLDALNGFGSCFFGHQPEFITTALHDQIDSGYEVGPQHPLAGEVSQLLCEFTGHDRAGLCNTGSEAVLGSMRIARTVTGRNLVVAFTGSYHGINDEALVRGSKKLKTFPAASGIMPGAVQNMLILDYGTQESLDIIRERAQELAAVLVEPVQSRRPDFQPIEFLRDIRKITEAAGAALIFDEVITGFRMHPQGAQGLFNIKADLAAYGKVIGGGLSIGAILGSKKYMDALDGGFWQYGDDSYPEVGVTYFAGTFVRHPLALASAKASLVFMKNEGPSLQQGISNKTEYLATTLNAEFKKRELPMCITYFGSLWKHKMLEDIPYSDLLFTLMREKGVHIWDGFPCFLTIAYTDADIDRVIKDMMSSIDALIAVGIFPDNGYLSLKENAENAPTTRELNQPPVPHARLGRDDQGNPAWYVPDEDQVGSYVKYDLKGSKEPATSN